jgi:hypothetical protein
MSATNQPRTREDCQAQEEAYTALRDVGMTARQASDLLGVNQRRHEVLASYYSAATDATISDHSAPKPSRDDSYVRAVLQAGYFEAFSEVRGPRGYAAVCLPMIPPRRAA